MVGDAHEALRALPGRGGCRVELVDHFAGERITEASTRGSRFQEAFPDQAEGELDELRRRFGCKAFVVRQEPVCGRLAGRRRRRRALRLGDGSPPARGARRYVRVPRRRRSWGMDARPDALVFTDAAGTPAGRRRADRRCARPARSVSIEGNTEFCTGLLAHAVRARGARR